jgi:threonine dehydrogenase-like Zn-dependent dehydrogenase
VQNLPGDPTKSVTWHGKEDVRVDAVPDPKIEEATEAVVRITSTAICGSTLHLYKVLGMWLEEGGIVGCEPMGMAEEVGAGHSYIEAGVD